MPVPGGTGATPESRRSCQTWHRRSRGGLRLWPRPLSWLQGRQQADRLGRRAAVSGRQQL